MKMFADTRLNGFARWKSVANIFIFLFILQGIASLVESEGSERGRNTTCSLRLTRQKVLIQEVDDPENSGKKRRIRRKYGSDNGDGYASPDIVVEEFRIRAKINFQKRSSDPGKLRNGLLPYRHEAQRNIEGPRGSSARGDNTGSANTHIETPGGISTPKSSSIVIGLPHSAVHEVFFDDGESGVDSESTVTPTIRRISNDKSVRDSTARLADNFNAPYELSVNPENFTNFLDESKLLEFVESLEDFLFDDSVTGTSDRKPLSSIDHDLLAESTNSVAETRSAIFKTKKFSAYNKKRKFGKNTKRSGNERSKKIDSTKSGKKQSVRSTTKRTSDVSPIGRKSRPKSGKKKIDKKAEKKIKRDKPKDKFRQVKISKSLMDFSSRRKGVREQNSTDKITVKRSEK